MAKSERILGLIQNVWSKKPISLVISNGETSRTILAQFDPTIDENKIIPTDASKIAGGNRHSNHTEQRVTLDLADDYYEIASDAKYNYSKKETGKKLNTHNDVNMWHYFFTEIYFMEQEGDSYTPYTVTVNVKEKDDGDFVYSFNAEKESSTRQTLHADVNTRKGANGELFLDNRIAKNQENVNTSPESSSENIRHKSRTTFNINDYSIDELIKFTDKEFEEAIASLSLEDILTDEDWNDPNLWKTIDQTVEDISEERNVEPERIRILVRRQGLGNSYIDDKSIAVMTKERINEAIEDSGAKYAPKYARKYITRISTKDFIDLTVSKNHMDRDVFDTEVKGDHGNTMGDYDYAKALKDSRQSPTIFQLKNQRLAVVYHPQFIAVYHHAQKREYISLFASISSLRKSIQPTADDMHLR